MGEESAKLLEMRQTVELLARTLANQELVSETGRDVLRVISDYAYALTLLDRYDHGTLSIEETTRKALHVIDYDEAIGIVASMKGEFDGLFGLEKDQGFKSALGAIYQTFGGEELYPSVEEKGANLLYFVVKNHAFSDGNKRIAAAVHILPRYERPPLSRRRPQAPGGQRPGSTDTAHCREPAGRERDYRQGNSQPDQQEELTDRHWIKPMTSLTISLKQLASLGRAPGTTWTDAPKRLTPHLVTSRWT